MKQIKILLLTAFATAGLVSCSSDDGKKKEDAAFYKIVNNGTGGVNSITDDSDFSALSVAQAIPSVSGESYPVNLPIIFFFDDKILLTSINEDTFTVTENNKKVGGVISVNEGANGYAIFTFTPKKQFAPNADITVTLSGIQDDGGQDLDQEVIIQYQTTSVPGGGFDNNLGFENGMSGVNFVGDGAILSGSYGCLSAYGGSNFGAITSGNQIVSNGSAVGGASSIMIVGPIDAEVSSVSFRYNFLSAEFQEYVGSEFDDSFMAIVVGEDGAYSEFVTSVNTVGESGNTQCLGFPGMPDNGDSYFGGTGWINKQMNFSSVGGEVYIVFIATDVADTIYSSIVGIDNITFN